MPTRVALLSAIAALALGACAAGPRPNILGASRPRARGAPRGARAPFTPARFHDVFANAVDVVRERGLEIASCDARTGRLVTAPVEMDAPCWGTTCLARETTHVKLGYRRARVILTREVWDPGLHAWRPFEDVSRLDEILREERDLIERVVDVAEEAPPDRPVVDPCAELRCPGASCVATHVVAAR
jgi:hypothetical protein